MYVIPTKNLLVVFIFKQTQFLKFNSSINLYLFGSPSNEWSTFIKDFNFLWRTKSSHSRVAIFTLIFIYYERISSLVFVLSGGDLCCFNEDVHPFTFLFIISTWLILLHLRIPIFPSYLMLHFISPLQFQRGFSSTLNNFLFSTGYVHINIWTGGVTCCSTCSGSFIHKKYYFGRRLRCTFFFLFLSFFSLFSISNSAALCFLNWSFLSVSIKRNFLSIYNLIQKTERSLQ